MLLSHSVAVQSVIATVYMSKRNKSSLAHTVCTYNSCNVRAPVLTPGVCVCTYTSTHSRCVYVRTPVLTPGVCMYIHQYSLQVCVCTYTSTHSRCVYVRTPVLTPGVCMYVHQYSLQVYTFTEKTKFLFKISSFEIVLPSDYH